MADEVGDRVEKTFVPMRNALFIVVAANRAVVWGCDVLVLGVCQQDNANYPDCREDFILRMQIAINDSLGQGPNRLKIVTPLMHLSKAQSISLAMNLRGAYPALAWTHTSYDGMYPPTDKNHSNLLRAQGFLEAGVPDPLVVRAWQEGLMNLPETDNYSDRAFRLAEDSIGVDGVISLIVPELPK